MFVILCYDIGIKRNAKVKKKVRQYLRPVQKSVAEGCITEGKLKKLQQQLSEIIDAEEDSITIYTSDAVVNSGKICMGKSLQNADFIL